MYVFQKHQPIVLYHFLQLFYQSPIVLQTLLVE